MALATVPDTLAATSDVNPAPLPICTLPVMLPATLISPVAAIFPTPMLPPGILRLLPVILSPVISPVALTMPREIILAPVTLPPADILLPADKLLLVTLPEPPSPLPTIKLPKVPTEVRLLFTTLELNVVPVSNAALEVATIPVNKLPFPIK